MCSGPFDVICDCAGLECVDDMTSGSGYSCGEPEDTGTSSPTKKPITPSPTNHPIGSKSSKQSKSTKVTPKPTPQPTSRPTGSKSTKSTKTLKTSSKVQSSALRGYQEMTDVE